MVAEILAELKPVPGEIVVDCTLGYGGHAQELWAAVQPDGHLIGLDVDPLELPRTEARLRERGLPESTLTLRRSNFAGLSKVLAEVAPAGANVILADLGVSSMQIDNPVRGFTFKADGPLDMRMNPRRGLPARELLTRTNPRELAHIFADYGDEPHAEFLAEKLSTQHVLAPFTTTRELADAIRQLAALFSRCDATQTELTVRRLFQALRIAVNDELGALEALLRQLPEALCPGGRVAILSFHSGEDRRVKQHFKAGLREGIYSQVSSLMQAGPRERRENPRSISAKLRVAVRANPPVREEEGRLFSQPSA